MERYDGEEKYIGEETKRNKTDCPVPWYRSYRYILAIVTFFGCIHIYAQRVGLSVGIVCMVNHTAVRLQNQADELSQGIDSVTLTYLEQTTHLNGFSVNGSLLKPETSCNDLSPGGGADKKDGPFVWSKDKQGHVLGAFFYGYLVSQVPGGLLAERFGGKWVFAVFFGISTFATLLSPLAARLHYVAFIAVRVLAGIGSGGLFPVILAFFSRWSPPHERSKLTNIAVAGNWMGSVLAMPLAGILCKYGFDDGWGSIFYVIGGSSAVWLVLWCFMASSNPSSHPHISQGEREYIVNSLKGEIVEKKAIPWRRMLTSGPVWAVIIGAIATDWGLYTYLTQIPTYFNEVLKFDVQSNGLLSALPFLGMWLSMSILPPIADRLITNKIMTTGAVRKTFQAIGGCGSAVFLIALSFMDCERSGVAVALLTLGVTWSGFQYSGFLVSSMDFAPSFAGTVFGIANGISSICGFMAPYVTAIITVDGTREQWQQVFFLSAGILTAGSVVFVLLNSGEVQPWAVDEDPEAEGETRLPLKPIVVQVNGTVEPNEHTR